MSRSLDVQVVTVTHNSSALIDRFYSDLDLGAASGVALTVVDSGSEDLETLEYQLRDKDAALIAVAKNVGYGSGSNIGAGRGDSEWIAFVNPDVQVRARELVDLCAIAATHGLACAGPVVRRPDGTVRDKAGLPWRRKFEPPTLASAEVAAAATIPGSCMVIRRDAFEGVGGFDQNFFMFGEEFDLHRRLWSAGYRVGVVNAVSALTDGGSSSANVTSRWAVTERDVAYFQYVRKHFSTVDALAALVYRGVAILVRPGYRPRIASLRQFVHGVRRVLATERWATIP